MARILRNRPISRMLGTVSSAARPRAISARKPRRTCSECVSMRPRPPGADESPPWRRTSAARQPVQPMGSSTYSRPPKLDDRRARGRVELLLRRLHARTLKNRLRASQPVGNRLLAQPAQVVSGHPDRRGARRQRLIQTLADAGGKPHQVNGPSETAPGRGAGVTEKRLTCGRHCSTPSIQPSRSTARSVSTVPAEHRETRSSWYLPKVAGYRS